VGANSQEFFSFFFLIIPTGNSPFDPTANTTRLMMPQLGVKQPRFD
jgi:hypothetical protein